MRDHRCVLALTAKVHEEPRVVVSIPRDLLWCNAETKHCDSIAQY